MTLTQLKSQTAAFIAEGQIDEAFELLELHLDHSKEGWQNFAAQRGRLKRATRRWNQTRIKFEDFDLIESQVAHSLSEMINELSPADLNTQSSGAPHQLIEDKIVVISPSAEEETLEETRKFFQKLRYKNTQVIALSEYRDLEQHVAFEKEAAAEEKIRLVVFDNRDLPFSPKEEYARPTVKARAALMQAFMEKTDYFFIHYGEVLYWLNTPEARRRFHPANSQFALYARVREMLDFMATMNV